MTTTLTSPGARIWIDAGRIELIDRLAAGESVPVTIRGRITGISEHDDWIHQDFEVEVESVETPTSTPTATIAIGPHSLAHGEVIRAGDGTATIRHGQRELTGRVIARKEAPDA